MEPTYLPGRAYPRLCRPENPPKTLPGRESDRDTGGNGAREHSPPPPRPPASSCPGRAPSPCFPPAPLPALSAVSLCAIGSRPCPRPSAPPRTPETPATRRSRFRRRRRAGAFSGSGASGLGWSAGSSLMFARSCPRLGSSLSWALKAPGRCAEEASGSPREKRSRRSGCSRVPGSARRLALPLDAPGYLQGKFSLGLRPRGARAVFLIIRVIERLSEVLMADPSF